MRLFSAASVLILCSFAFAADQPAVSYQDAMLVSFRTVSTGSDCTSNGIVKGTADDDGNINGTSTSTSSCSNSRIRQYTIKVGDSIYVMELASLSAGKAAGAVAAATVTMGFGALFFRPHDILANQLPGNHILIASHGNGFQVKVGKKTSEYALVGAQ